MSGVSLVRMIPDNAEAVAAFLSGNSFPFHTNGSLTVEGAMEVVAAGRYWSDESQGYWLRVGDTVIGIAVLEDLQDPTVMFDLRLADRERGRGLAVPALVALCELVFDSIPHVRRLEGLTREDNLAMRRTFLRAGFVKEAHFRDAWPIDDGEPLASVAYAMLRRDFESGTTTSVPWNDST